MSNIVIALADDWTGLYINDVLSDEGHSISLHDALKATIGEEVESVEERWLHPDWITLHGTLPTDINEVVWEEDDYSLPEDSDDGFADYDKLKF